MVFDTSTQTSRYCVFIDCYRTVLYIIISELVKLIVLPGIDFIASILGP